MKQSFKTDRKTSLEAKKTVLDSDVVSNLLYVREWLTLLNQMQRLEESEMWL